MIDSCSAGKPGLVCVYKHLDLGGGVASLLLETVPLLLRDYAVRVLCYRRAGNGAERLLDLGVPVDVVPLGSKWAPWNLSRFTRYFRQHRPQVVHCHEYTANTLGSVAAARAGVPVRMRHLHSMAPWGWMGPWRTRNRIAVDRAAARRSGITLAVSRAVAAIYLRETRLPDETCRVVYNGVDLERFRPDPQGGAAVRAEWGMSEGTPLVGIVGRLGRGKGHSEFLEAAKGIATRVPSARFAVVGEGGLQRELEAHAARLGLEDRVLFAGRRDDVPQVMNAMDVFLFPSVPDAAGRIQDGLPLVVLEALAAGLPVVAFDLPMVAEVLRDGSAGRIVPCGDTEAMAEAASRFLAVRERRASNASEARASVQCFTWNAWVGEVSAIYRKLGESSRAVVG